MWYDESVLYILFLIYMKLFTSFGAINSITRIEFFRDLFSVIVWLGIFWSIINVFFPWISPITSWVLSIFMLKFIYILIVKRFHNFNRLGKFWAKAYIVYIISIQIIFAVIFSELNLSFIMNHEIIFFIILLLIFFFPLLIIGAIPPVVKEKQ